MKKLRTLSMIVFLLITLTIFGQKETGKSDELPYIEVEGKAEKEVIPDEIYIGIVIREKYVNKIKITIEEQEEKLINAVKSLGIDIADLNLSNANADYVKIRWQQKDVLTKKDYTLKASNATTVGQVFQELEKLEINDAFISKVSHSKIDSLRKEVKIAAIKEAKNKADYLLAAIGEETGKPLVITEDIHNIVIQDLPRMPMRYVADTKNLYSNSNASNSGKENEIDFQKIKLTANIYVKFAIK